MAAGEAKLQQLGADEEKQEELGAADSKQQLGASGQKITEKMQLKLLPSSPPPTRRLIIKKNE
jgi:hypothetical protein